MHSGITEAERGSALTGDGGGWMLELLEERRGQDSRVGELLDLEQSSVDVVADGPQLRQRVQAFVGLEVLGVVDRRFRAQCLGFLEVLLHMAALVRDVQAWDDAGSDDTGAVARWWWRGAARPMDREEQTDLIRTAQVQVGADDGFEEAA